MNKKIASEIAIGIILLVAILVGGAFWLQARKAERQVSQNSMPEMSSSEQAVTTSVMSPEIAIPKNEQVPSGQIPKSYTDENVQWLDVPKEVTDIELFKKDFDTQYKIWETGTVKNGEYVGGRILLAVTSADGPGGPGVFRFVQKKTDNQLYLLKNYSNADFFDNFTDKSNDDWYSVNKKLFSYMGQYAYGLRIASLEYPGTLFTPKGQQLKKEEEYPFEWLYAGDGNVSKDYLAKGLFFRTDLLKFSFTDPVYGDVYMTDVSKVSDSNRNSVFSESGFYLKAPDGTFKTYSSVIDLGGDIPKVTWNDGTQNDSKFSYKTESGCGASNYVSDVSNVIADGDLFQLGLAQNGDVIYGYKDSNSKALKDFYVEYQKLSKDENMIPRYYPDDKPRKLTYDQFLQTHPMFFWKDSFGRTIQFINLHYIFSGGCGKPVIYLYPEQTENISVKVTPTAGMTVSIPEYGEGWNVVADTQSNILNLADNKTYPYLFWEGSGDSIYHMSPKGFVVVKDDLGSFFDDKLFQSGLIKKEINDFKEFWVPRMSAENKPYYFVTFVDRATVDKLAPLEIVPMPDTTIRVLMDYKGLDFPITAQGFNIKTPQRSGFTAVEWGGVLR